MIFITWPINRAKYTSVRYYTSRNHTYAHMTARYSFCSGQSSYVQCWVQAQQHLPTYSVMNCLLISSASVTMVLYITPSVWGPQWVLQWFIVNLLNLFCPTIRTYLFMLSTTLLRSHWKNHCLPLIYAMHIDFSPTLSVIINICYIILVKDVRRMGEYCTSQQSDQNEGSLWMAVLKRKSRETKWPWTVSYWQLVAMLREPHLKIPRSHIVATEFPFIYMVTWALNTKYTDNFEVLNCLYLVCQRYVFIILQEFWWRQCGLSLQSAII